MRLIIITLAASCMAFGQFSYNDLKQKVEGDGDRHAIQAEIKDQGIDFNLNLDMLKQMKRDHMPNWLIDYLVITEAVLSRDRTYAGASPGYHRGYGPGYYAAPWNIWWWDYYAWDPFYSNPWYGFAYPWSVWYPAWYWYGGRDIVGSPGHHVSPRGYHRSNRGDRGRARPRNSGSDSGATRNTGSSRGSSRSGTVTPRGYKRD